MQRGLFVLTIQSAVRSPIVSIPARRHPRREEKRLARAGLSARGPPKCKRAPVGQLSLRIGTSSEQTVHFAMGAILPPRVSVDGCPVTHL